MNFRIFNPKETGFDEPGRSADGRQENNSAVGEYIPLHYHFNMLQDRFRMTAFKSAIQRVVTAEMNVLELGGGTGVLSSFAAKCGADVTCVEYLEELVQFSSEMLKNNGLQDQVKVVHGDARNFVPDAPVQVVICEMLHVGLLREKQVEVISKFKANYQAAFPDQPMPIFLPEASILTVQLVQQDYDFGGYNVPVPMFQVATGHSHGTLELSDLTPYGMVEYQDELPDRFQMDQAIDVKMAGRCNSLRFVTQNVVAFDRRGEDPVNWPNQAMVIPIKESFDVIPGQRLATRFEYSAGCEIPELQADLLVQWESDARNTTPLTVPTRCVA